MKLCQQISAALERLRAGAPLIHCITNYVTAGDTANMLLAAGASPIMADDPAESAEITALAAGLTLNLGTPSKSRIEAMLRSGEAANRRDIPVVFDPVGAGCSELRRNAVSDLIRRVKLSAVRGNLSEMSYLAGFAAQERGVDTADLAVSPRSAAEAAAKRLSCVCAVTGERDVISDGSRTVVIRNGTKLLRNITGAGCMTSALCAAFISVSDPFTGTAAGIAFMDVCGEIAAENSRGMGGFRMALFDAAGNITPETLAERLIIDES
ncbi:MAG: hydroxyethylthiazole kinase [Oscillospiraceae bacterium]